MPPRNSRRMVNTSLLDAATDRTARLFGVEGGYSLRELDVDRIEPNPDQPRRHFDEDELDALAASIRKHGLLQPVCVQEIAPDRFQLVAGERRLRAFLRLERTTIPAIVVRTSDPEVLSLIENVQRVDLDAFEVAGALHQLLTRHGASHSALGEMLGKSQAYVTRTLGILRLPAPIKAEYAENRHVPTSALMLIAETEGERRQLDLWKLAKAGGSVRSIQEARRTDAPPRADRDDPADFSRVFRSLSRGVHAVRVLDEGGALGLEERRKLKSLRDEIDDLLNRSGGEG